jgi:hypothetical protein
MDDLKGQIFHSWQVPAPIDFSAVPGWLNCCLLAERYQLTGKEPVVQDSLGGFCHSFFVFLEVHVGLTRKAELKQSPSAEPHTDDGVLPGALKGSFVILLRPPECLAAIGIIPYTILLPPPECLGAIGIMPYTFSRPEP